MIESSFETVPCDVCGRDESTALVTKNGYQVVRCRDCGLVYVSPRPRQGELARLYDSESYQAHQAKRADELENETDWRRQAKARLALLDQVQPGRGALLDVGCSTGGFLAIARDNGWRVSGLDLSTGSVARARARGLDVHLATLESHGLARGTFQAVTMFDSIEHMPSPMTALRAVDALLARGGVVVLTTPNVEGLLPRVTWQLLGRTIGAWEHPTPPGHIYQFGARTLREALRRAGFEVVHESTEAIPIGHSVSELEGAVVDAFKRRSGRPAAMEAGAAPRTPPLPGGAPGAVSRPLRLSRRAVRAVVRAGAWALVGPIAPLAPLVGSGDSLVVIARKA